jgi:hypothetical protein
MHAFLLAMLACSIKDEPPAANGTDDSGGEPYPSGYTDGEYRVSALTILPAGEGKDWDGDGDADNKLPDVLAAFDFLLGAFDVSKPGLNILVADAIRNDSLVVLVDAAYDGGLLTLDFLAGSADGDGSFSIDSEQSYDDDGNPVSRLEGTFVGATAYVAGPDSMVIAIPVDASGTPAPFPLEEVTMQGELGAIDLDGDIVGIVPVDRFVAAVLPIFVPAQGYDLNGNEAIDPDTESQAAITELVTTLLDTSADTATQGGEPAISAALHFAAGAANFD